MKGNPKLLDKLNQLLFDELTAINQYMVHSEMCENWGYDKLYENIRARAFTEMRHAEKLIERILFFEGTPVVSNLGQINIGQEVPKQLENDLNAEMAAEVGDNATKDILEEILADEDEHVDDIEAKQDRIQQMGLPMFLSTQTK